MNRHEFVDPAITEMAGRPEVPTAQPPPDTRLSGAPLTLARAAVVAVATFIVMAGLAALPTLYATLARPCAAALQTCLVTPQQVAPLARLGISPGLLALGVIALTLCAVALVDAVAALIFWRRSDDWMALLVTLTLLLLPALLTPGLQSLRGPLAGVASAVSQLAFPALMLVVALFPSGRFVPRWVWAPTLLLALTPQWAGRLQLPNALFLPLVLGLCVTLIGSQIYRYRQVSSPVQRAQTKWVVYGLALTVLINQAFWQPFAAVPALGRTDSLFPLLDYLDSFLMLFVLAGAFAIAMLRYRLYEIDVIIRRTLIYGALTVVLAAVYFALVLGGQALLRAVLGLRTQQPILIVGSTLLVAALFTPLRRWLQSAIDRHFYRHKYNAARTLEAFGAALRTETDLAAMREQLLDVVDETMQPALVSLWLSPSPRVLELAGGNAPAQPPSGATPPEAHA
jgi:hypothetical protein